MSRMNIQWQSYLGQYLCPVCGLPGYFDERAFDDEGGCIAEGICPCCFFEPGYNDDPGASADAKPTVLETVLCCRERWIADGMPWRRGTREERMAIGVYSEERASDDAPDNWAPQEQLEHLLRIAPELS